MQALDTLVLFLIYFFQNESFQVLLQNNKIKQKQTKHNFLALNLICLWNCFLLLYLITNNICFQSLNYSCQEMCLFLFIFLRMLKRSMMFSWLKIKEWLHFHCLMSFFKKKNLDFILLRKMRYVYDSNHCIISDIQANQ